MYLGVHRLASGAESAEGGGRARGHSDSEDRAEDAAPHLGLREQDEGAAYTLPEGLLFAVFLNVGGRLLPSPRCEHVWKRMHAYTRERIIAIAYSPYLSFS